MPKTTGGPTFALEFHFPYYAWRRMLPIEEDPQSHARNSRPPRRSEPVIHLSSGTESADEDDDFIHEAQVSVMVTGLDNWFWTACCFSDIYFKDEDHNEQVSTLSTPAHPMDPHSCGKFSLNLPIWDPRHYFLRTLSCRMEQVKQEWNNTVFQLFEDIEPCVRPTFPLLLPSS